MPDATGITDFDYHHSVDDFEVTSKGVETREAMEDDEATPLHKTPLSLPRGEN